MSAIHSRSPIPIPRSPSKAPSPHIMPKHDMIRSYSASSTPSASLTPKPVPLSSPSLTPLPSPSALASPSALPMQNLSEPTHMYSIGVIGLLIFFVLRYLRLDLTTKKPKQKVEGFSAHGVNIHEYPQQINPTAYNTLNLIRRASSNNLGNISPV